MYNGIYNNYLCPPYPDCIDYIGEQNTGWCDGCFDCDWLNPDGGDDPYECMQEGKQYGCNFHYIIIPLR